MDRNEQTEAARDGAVVFVAMELSKSAWLLAAQASPCGKASSHRLDGDDIAGLLALLRCLHARERQQLITERVQHVNRIKGLLATQGIYLFLPLRRDRWVRLEELRTGDGRELPLRLRHEIER